MAENATPATPAPVELPENLDVLTLTELDGLLETAVAYREHVKAQPVSLARNTELAAAVEAANAVIVTRNAVVTLSLPEEEQIAEAPAEDETPTPETEEVEPEVAEPVIETVADRLPVAAATSSAAPSRPVTPAPVAPVGFRSMAGHDHNNVIDVRELGSRLAAAMGPKQGVQMVAAVERFAADAPRLGADARANHQILFGGRQDLSITAAICGPTDPIPAPSCALAGEPHGDNIRNYPIVNGQIQVFAPLQLEDFQKSIMIPAPDCEGACGIDAPDLDCGEIDQKACDPLPSVKAEPMSACLCVSESFMWSNENMVEEAVNLTRIALSAAIEQWRMQWMRSQSFVRSFAEPYGHSRGTVHALLQVMSHINYGRQDFAGGTWKLAIPRGSMYASMADAANANRINLDGLLEDLVSKINVDVYEYLDHDPTAPAPAPTGLTGALGVSTTLEDFYQTPSFFLYHEDAFLGGQLGRSEWGIDATDRELMAKGCRRLIVREWNMRPVKFGCTPSVVIDFDTVCVSGTGPDDTAPFCP